MSEFIAYLNPTELPQRTNKPEESEDVEANNPGVFNLHYLSRRGTASPANCHEQ